MAKHSVAILELARRGAKARYEELQAEISSLIRQFPEIAGEAVKKGRRAVKAVRELATATTPKRKRRKMTAAQKKAVGIRMKAYWAARRKAKG